MSLNRGGFSATTRDYHSFCLLFLLILSLRSQAIGEIPRGVHPDYSLDRESVRALYVEGEFHEVIEALEFFRDHNPNPTRAEKIFAYKFLSVVYAANEKTKLKSEYYMYELIKMVPTIQLLDMYVSASVETQFQKVRERFLKEQEYTSKFDLIGDPKAEEKATSVAPIEVEPPPTRKTEAPKSGSNWIPWTLGGVAIVGAITAFVILSDNDSESPPNTITSGGTIK